MEKFVCTNERMIEWLNFCVNPCLPRTHIAPPQARARSRFYVPPQTAWKSWRARIFHVIKIGATIKEILGFHSDRLFGSLPLFCVW